MLLLHAARRSDGRASTTAATPADGTDRRLGLRTHDDEAVPEHAPRNARAAGAGAVAEVR